MTKQGRVVLLTRLRANAVLVEGLIISKPYAGKLSAWRVKAGDEGAEFRDIGQSINISEEIFDAAIDAVQNQNHLNRYADDDLFSAIAAL